MSFQIVLKKDTKIKLPYKLQVFIIQKKNKLNNFA